MASKYDDPELRSLILNEDRTYKDKEIAQMLGLASPGVVKKIRFMLKHPEEYQIQESKRKKIQRASRGCLKNFDLVDTEEL